MDVGRQGRCLFALPPQGGVTQLYAHDNVGVNQGMKPRLRVVVFIRVRVVALMLARKDMAWGGQKWLAERMGVSQAYMSLMMSGQKPVPTRRQALLMEAFRGMSHKKGGRLCWDDVFQPVYREPSGTSL